MLVFRDSLPLSEPGEVESDEKERASDGDVGGVEKRASRCIRSASESIGSSSASVRTEIVPKNNQYRARIIGEKENCITRF